MEVRERINLCNISCKIYNNPEYSKGVGLLDKTHFKSQTNLRKRGNKNEEKKNYENSVNNNNHLPNNV
jgi:hypothetical protein